MPNRTQNDPTKIFSLRFLPWITGALMFVAYLATLNHWVTLANIWPVSKISGFIWQPDFFGPLQYLFTLPFHWLPAAKVPLALNVFSAVCAAVILGLLARCVAILPHDRTEMERTREKSDFSFLTTGSAWFPPVLAAVMLGLEFGFWQNATSYTGEMLALLPFAVVVWLLLEYRIDERPGRLTLAAIIFGAGIADNWAFIGFFPVFLVALIWLKGWEFFNARFLGRMAMAGLAGLSLILLLPIIGTFSSNYSVSFWEILKPVLHNNWMVIKAISIGDVRYNLLIMSVATLLPLLVMAIRWSANFGDSSQMGTLLSSYMFHGIHAVILTTCIWAMFDPPFSPSERAMGSPALTFYFLTALALGYYAGYYLLVFGKKAIPSRRNPHPLPALPGALNALSPVIYWGTYLTAGLVVAAIIYKNLPQIRAQNDNTLLHYAQLTEQTLPANGGILLTDAEGVTSSQLTRTLLMQAALARCGRSKDFLVVDTQSLNWAPYHRYLHKKAPDKWPNLVGDTGDGGVGLVTLLGALELTSKSNNLCYLNPSFGYYFEFFYQEPHGLVYQLKKYPETSFIAPALSAPLISENQSFWKNTADLEFDRLEKAIVPYDPQARMNLFNWINMHLHGKYQANPNALFVANLYSRALNYWGVQLQRAGQVPAAAEWFAEAQKINPDNIVAEYNLKFNATLQSGIATNAALSAISEDMFGKYRSWNAVMNANGPYDEPSFCYNIGLGFMNNSLNGYPLPLTRQAVAEFSRVSQLLPKDLGVRLTLGQLYLLSRKPDDALQALHEPLLHPQQFGLTVSNATELNVLASAACFQKEEIARGVALLEKEMTVHPDDMTLITSTVQAYFLHGLYSNALHVINRQLARSPDDAQWLFGKGFANLQMSNYNQAVTAFTRVLQIATNDATARFNRALAYLQGDRLNEARADYLELQATYTNAFQVSYGLAEIAWRQRQTNEAIKQYQAYLANAPTNAAELGTARERLKQLQKN